MSKSAYRSVGGMANGLVTGSMASAELEASSCVGTPQYISPEMLIGQKYSNLADTWALGVVIFETLALQYACCLPHHTRIGPMSPVLAPRLHASTLARFYVPQESFFWFEPIAHNLNRE